LRRGPENLSEQRREPTKNSTHIRRRRHTSTWANCQMPVCGIFSTSHLTISPLVASWLVAIGLLGSDMIWWGDDRIHHSLQQSVGHLRVCWGLKRNFVQLHYGAVIETLQESGSKFVSSNSPIAGVTVIWAFPRFGHPHSQNPNDIFILCSPNPNPNPNH